MLKVRKLKVVAIIALLLNAIACVSVVYASSTNPEMITIPEKILEYALKGLQEYFNFLIELFKLAMGI